MNCLKKRTWIPQQGLAATAPDHVVSRADVDRAPGNGICDPQYFADILDYTRKLLFALSQVILVLLTGNELPDLTSDDPGQSEEVRLRRQNSRN